MQMKLDTLDAARVLGDLALVLGETVEAFGLVADAAGQLDGLARGAGPTGRLRVLRGAAARRIS